MHSRFTPIISTTLAAALAIIAVAALASCGNRHTRQQLECAETLVDEHPDSAYAIISAIDPATLRGDADHARHALLLTQALDKLHQPLPPDSVIAVATRHYATSADRQRAMRAFYYHGRVKYLDRNYPSGLVMFFKARDLALTLDDHFWAGLACRGISDTYFETYDITEELQYAREEYHHFHEAKRWLYLRYAMNDLARAYFHNGLYANAIDISRQVIDSARTVNDDYLLYEATKSIAFNLTAQDDFKAALPYLEDICHTESRTPDDFAMLAYAYLHCDNAHKAISIMDSIHFADNDFNNYVRFKLYKSLGRDKDALEAVSRYLDYKFESVENKMATNVASSIEEYYKEINAKTNSELEVTRLRIWLILISSLLAITIILFMGQAEFPVHLLKRGDWSVKILGV